ncbi:80 kD MCM3-associated protein/SAC3 family protein [Blumeria hordei DH14]|uniref:80 kD MCM3-associated protein/SAC3 family protein n=1 Tax=Blumeria graminis f. sp. hordei (strain DH14) TaxID=546991 RepID=N1JPA9_BLUG1|nr:80 kD MCM3-associated protein/SAC3 family protein [Blumeria hordei DH14]
MDGKIQRLVENKNQVRLRENSKFENEEEIETLDSTSDHSESKSKSWTVATVPASNPFATASHNGVALNPFQAVQKLTNFGTPSVSVFNGLGINKVNSMLRSNIAGKASGNSQNTHNPFAGQKGTTLSTHADAPNFETLPQTTTNPNSLLNFNLLEPTNQKNVIEACSSTLEKQSSFAQKIEDQLHLDGIVSPSISSLDYDKKQEEFIQSAAELRKEFLKYRDKVRISLIKANLLDDPNVPKKLEDAIDFKGTCSEMCPEFECITRIIDRRYDKSEKDVQPDGSYSHQPNLGKMVKALARSAAGQDAPLPSDIRTPAALRKTVDYLFNDILGERELDTIHGFLWDRTRAIRRDFVFHSTLTSLELVDQVYCLERITRFHVISLHQMSKDGISAEGFSDQQEREQLSKSLLSLIHAYEDCKLQGVDCENEIEFKAYYILFNGEIPGIMETVQNWGWDLWGSSELIRIAVSLSESLQNTWDIHGPLYPASTTEVGQNAYSKFFSIIESSNVSYTMACFAEIYFNKIRKAILSTILTSYRKQRGQTKDWTPRKLNKFLRFDKEVEIEPFVELYGLHFAETDGEWCLSYDSANHIEDPHPLPKQPHSFHLVERKRGNRSLSEAIHTNLFEDIASRDQFTAQRFNSEESISSTRSTEQKLKVDNQSQADDKIALDRSSCITDDGETSSTREFENETTRVNFIPPSKLFPQPTPSHSNSNLTLTSTKENIKWPSSSALFTKNLSTTIFTQPSLVNSQASRILDSAKNDSQPITNIQPPTQTFTFNANLGKPNPPGLLDISTTPENTPLQSTATTSPFRVQQPDRLSTNTNLTVKEQLGIGMQEKAITPEINANTLVQSNTLIPSNINLSSLPEPTTGPISLISEQKNEIEAPERNSILSNQRQSRLDSLAEWVLLGDDGLLEHFSETVAKKVVHDTFTKFINDLQNEFQEKIDKQALLEASQFRRRNLAIRYGYFWLDQARKLRVKRRGREARKARIEMAKKSKEEKNLQISTVARRRRRDSLESALDTNRELSHFQNINNKPRSLTMSGGPKHKRQCSERSDVSFNTTYSNSNTFPTNKPENPSRCSLLSDPSYLSGGSRIHLQCGKSNEEKRKQISGVQTDYFRLKARGIMTLPDGRPLANMAARHISQHQSFDNLNWSIKNVSFQPSSASDLDLNLPDMHSQHEEFSDTYSDDTDLLKLEAKTSVREGPFKNNPSRPVDDDELFDRARKIRKKWTKVLIGFGMKLSVEQTVTDECRSKPYGVVVKILISWHDLVSMLELLMEAY